MEILLHIGPHKTATTSLQHSLLKQYGTKTPGSIWYPPPVNHGPGHAELAWDFFNQTTHNHTTSHEALHNIAITAEQYGCQKLIISAEDFSHLENQAIGKIREQLKAYDCHLLVTLTPFRRRVVSTWQETVKHGNEETLESFIRQIPNLLPMQGNLINRWVEMLAPKKTSIVDIKPEAPVEQVFQDISELTGTNLQPETTRLNPGLGAIETNILRILNACKLTKKYGTARTLALGILNSETWRRLVPKRLITIPPESEPTILQLCVNNSKCLEDLRMQDSIVWK